MRDILNLFLILGLYASRCQSKELGGTPIQDPQYNVVTKHTETEPYEYYDDGDIGTNCYTEENHCTSALSDIPKPICVYKKKMGLTNFFGLCTIRLHKCLIKQQNKLKNGSVSPDEEIYYNGKSFDCQYYGAHFKSERQAIIWYFKLGGLDAETEDITQPFENVV